MKTSRHSLTARLRYAFENTLSKGPVAIIGWLAILSLGIILVAAAVMVALRVGYGDDASFVENFWNSLMRTFDAGNMADDGAATDGKSANWAIRIVALAVSLGGIFVISTLIGTLTSGIEGKLDELRKGRSKVLETGHTLILGWSPKVFAIISELIVANENQKRPVIVILADLDKVEMEDELKTRFPSTKNTRVVCRTGSPSDLDELEIASPHDAKSIIILAPESKNPDISVIKSILALTNNPNRRTGHYHIVAEIRDESNMEAARLVGGSEAVLVESADLIARVTAQTCRQSGLSVVYTELLDFDGAELYFSEERSLVGRTYRDAVFAYDQSTVIGLFTPEKTPLINPPMDTVIQPGTQIVAISEDDDTVVVSTGQGTPNESLIRLGERSEIGPERTLVLGWNDKAGLIIREFSHYVREGSVVTVATRESLTPEEQAKVEGHGTTVRFLVGNTTERAFVESLEVTTYDHIVVLCYSGLDEQEADSMTLITLLHLRGIAEEAGTDLNVVSEMLDIRNRALAEVAKADDFIVSDKLVSLMLSQLSENKDLQSVFAELFCDEGSEIYLKPVGDYVATGAELDFYTVLEAAARRGETAIGYRIAAQAQDKEKAFGVNCNPKKSDVLRFEPEDKVIVLALC